MKMHRISLRFGSVVTILLLLTAFVAQAQSTIESEVPGDNFSLEGALELFKKSSSPEEFEKMLNSSDSRVNNLDLNNDGRIDYIRVIDRNEGNVHAFIIQAVISQSESQDVAVIELEKLADGKAILQITGDADVYGMETIIEPTEEVRVNAGTTTARTVVNVWTWPSVQYVYGPTYSVWVSPWSWAYHPFWWTPWRPVAYYVYDPWWRPYRPYYAVCYTHRIGYLPVIYHPYRRSSVVVYHNHRHQIDGYRSRYSGSGSRSDRYASDRYSSNGRSRGNGRSDGYSSGRIRTENTSSNFVRTRNSRSSEFNRDVNREQRVSRDLDSRNNGNDRQISDVSDRQISDRPFDRNSSDSNIRSRERTTRSQGVEQREYRVNENTGRSNSSVRQTREPAQNMRTINDQRSRSSAPSVGRSGNSRPSISNGGGNRSGGNRSGGNIGGSRSGGSSRSGGRGRN